MTALSVNVNKVAWLRNARGGNRPDLLWAVRTCIEAGAHGITVHPRPDARHIRPDDVTAIAAAIDVEYNIEGNPFEGPRDGYPGFMQLVEETRPAQATLVPDSVDQLTSNHGWDLARDAARLRPAIAQLKSYDCRVSLFMDPTPETYEPLVDVGADRIELYTENYAVAHARGDAGPQLARYRAASERARELGLGVNAGHDLDLSNLNDFLGAVPGVQEVSIGHALISDALEFGLAETVRRYLDRLP